MRDSEKKRKTKNVSKVLRLLTTRTVFIVGISVQFYRIRLNIGKKKHAFQADAIQSIVFVYNIGIHAHDSSLNHGRNLRPA